MFLYSLYQVYPARVPTSNTTQFVELSMINNRLRPGAGRSAYMQGAYQLIGMIITLVVSLIGGLITGE